MNGYLASMKAEFLKVRRARAFRLSLLLSVFVPLMMGFLMYVSMNPEYAAKIGLIGSKAQLIGSADWKGYFALLSEAVAVGGIFLFGFVVSWIFGREYSDRTFKDLIALPVRRSAVALSKFTVGALWCAVIIAVITLGGLLMGFAIGIPGWSADIEARGLAVTLIAGLLTALCSQTAAFFASWGKGFLAPLAFVVLTMILAQVAGAIGYGAYFPWASPRYIPAPRATRYSAWRVTSCTSQRSPRASPRRCYGGGSRTTSKQAETAADNGGASGLPRPTGR